MGGEPTCYNNLIKAINLCKRLEISTVLVTNGIKLADGNYVRQLRNAGLNRISLSLKGIDNYDFLDVTGIDSFNSVLKAIENLSNDVIPFSISMVLSPTNISSFTKGVIAARTIGARHFSFSFCYDFSALNNDSIATERYDFDKNIFRVIDEFINQYDELCIILDNDFTLSQSFPLCAWPEEFITQMANKHQLRSVCQLLRHSGLIFDIGFNIIPCNAMYQLILGKYREDFSNVDDFKVFWRSTKVEEVFNRLRSLPSIKCKSCKWLSLCGGGCISHWFNFNFDEFEQARDDYFLKKQRRYS